MINDSSKNIIEIKTISDDDLEFKPVDYKYHLKDKMMKQITAKEKNLPDSIKTIFFDKFSINI